MTDFPKDLREGASAEVDFNSPITKDQLDGTQRPRGDWFQTYTGKQFWVLNPRSEDIDIRDIAHALSMICRFGGHCNSFYSVAQHSIHVTSFYGELVRHTLLADDHKGYLAALLHDASEAYTGDLIRPLKRSFPELKAFEQCVHSVVLEHFGLEEIWPKAYPYIKQADEIALATEKRDLMSVGVGTWKVNAVPHSTTRISAMSQEPAKQWFLQFYRGLLTSFDAGLPPPV